MGLVVAARRAGYSPNTTPVVHEIPSDSATAHAVITGCQSVNFWVSAGRDRDSARQSTPSLRLSERSVFCISIVIVIGPTPPGTGVMDPAIFTASSICPTPDVNWHASKMTVPE